MTQIQIRKKVHVWAQINRPDWARNQLILSGVSPRAAEQMVAGKYKHRIRQSTINKLRKAGAVE